MTRLQEMDPSYHESTQLVGKGALALRIGLLIVAIVYCVHKYVQRRWDHNANESLGRQHGCLPIKATYPCKWPLGLDVLYAQYKANADRRLLAFQEPFLDELGPNVEAKILGTSGYTTFDPENVEAILSSHFQDFYLGTRRGVMFPFVGEGIFTQDEQPWQHSRELLRRPFLRAHYQNLKGFLGPINRIISELRETEIVDLQPWFFQFTLTTTTALIFGQPIDSLGTQKDKTFATSFSHASFVSAVRMRLVDFYWTYRPRSYQRACKYIKEYADEIVQRALANSSTTPSEQSPEDYGFIQELYAELQNPTLVRDQLVNILLAGRDTTACLLSWTFFLLVRHPEVLNRLRKEISVIVEDDTQLTRSHIQKMAYLKCVLNETLRLYPPIPINIRFTKRTTCLPRGGGPDGRSPILIKRGLGVGFVPYYLHRRKDIYGEDAREYRPERWEDPKLAELGSAYVPFHGGPRLCLGKDFALMEASCAVVRILQEFPKLRLPPGLAVDPVGQEKQDLGVFLKPAEGCKVLLN